MDITQLPEEVFIDIAKYLSTDDLFSCSLVNFSWRNFINSNEIWHHVCKNFIVCKSGEELNYLESLVTNSSESKSNYEPYSAIDFEPLCKWRKTFMRWAKLKCNWSKGNFKCFKMVEMLSDFHTTEGDDDIFLFVYDNARKISVWDIKNVPYHVEDIKFSLYHVCSNFIKVCNNYLVIVQCNLLQVFHYTDNGFQLSYRCLFDKDVSHLSSLPHDYNISQWYSSNINLFPCDLTLRCDQNGHQFIGAILDGDYNKTIINIWNLKEKSEKIEVFIPNSSDLFINDINFSATEHQLYLMIRNSCHTNSYDIVFIYDLKRYRYLDFKLSFTYVVPAFIFRDNLILAIDEFGKCLNIWKVNKKINTKIDCNFFIDLRCFNIAGSHLLIGGKNVLENSQRTVSVFKLFSLECIFTTNVSYKVDFILLIQNTFLLLSGFCSRYFVSVTDIFKKCCLFTIEHHDFISVNSIHSKLITRADDSEVNLITFW
ncbi:uncharacterized protein LOC142323136 [Lycorma delicatula]|uniref:uncharacterized protein LOC142323136 n=1 Tax=Lycorma delicatula TaxID=130591 RepID=UPI003F518DB4